MKLIRYGEPGAEKPGIQLPDGQRIDVSAFGKDYDEHFFGTDGPDRLAEWHSRQPGGPEISQHTRLGPPVCRPSKIICIGLNYSDHAAESGQEVPEEPIIFFKATSAISGPGDQLVIPRDSKKTDWEVELALVIGKKASYVDEHVALDHVAGYALHNDYSEREFQMERCGQWVKGKSADTFAPFGPFLATPDEVRDPHNLAMWLKVNGETKQDGNTNTMVFKVPKLISYLSQFMSLLPGDIVSTGTPPGVGAATGTFIQPGDVIECGIERLGEQRQEAADWPG